MMATTYSTASDFLQTAAQWLEKREAVNNLMLGLAGRLARAERPADPPPVMMTVCGPKGLAAAALMTPPRGVVLYAPGEQATPALEALADALLAGGHAVPECLGPSATALAFAQIWAGRTGQEPTLKMAQRIYELRKVAFPREVPGCPRLPRPEDLDLVADWVHQFRLEVMQEDNRASARTSAEQIVAGGQLLLWEDHGTPVSMAAAQRPTRHGVAISAVYTPPERRRQGYATACVAALSQRQLDAGRQFCCLYTDLANPTSNSIYQKIGYVLVADSSHYRFDPPQGRPVA